MPFLEIKNLHKTFYAPDGSITAIISLPALTLEKGAQLLLTGASGSGKSTILYIIAGLLQPDTGTILCRGEDLQGLTPLARDTWRAQFLGYVFQSFNLLEELSVAENLMTAGWLAGRRDTQSLRQDAEAWLERVGLAAKKDNRPATLSLGEKQRVAVVRALYNKPQLVLADEPTASLDHPNGVRVLKLLQELCQVSQASLILSSHDEYIKTQLTCSYDLVSGKLSGNQGVYLHTKEGEKV